MSEYSQSRALGFAFVTLLMWSTAATAFKLTLRYATVLQTLAIAVAISSLALLMLVALNRQGKTLITVLRQYWRISLVAGLMNPVIYYLILFEAYDRLPAQLAQPINITWTIVLSLMAGFLLRQPIQRFDYLAAVISYGGVILIVSQGDLAGIFNADWIGVGLAILSTLVWAGYWTVNIQDRRPPLVGMCLNFLVATPVVLLVWLVLDGEVPSAEGLLGGVYIGLFEMSLAFVCWSLALKSTPNAATISNLIFLSPFLSLQFIEWLVGETIHWTTYVGLVIIIAGIAYQQLRHRQLSHYANPIQ